MSQAHKFVLVCGLLSIALIVCFVETDITNSTQTSRLATIDALVNYRTFAIDLTLSSWPSRDVSMYRGHFYSPKPPMLAAVAAVAYGLFSKMTAVTFESHPRIAIGFLSLLVGLLPHIFLMVYFYKLLKLWVHGPAALAWGFAGISLGYLGVGFATSLNNHTPAAALIIISFYYAYLIRSGLSNKTKHWLLSGFLISLAAAFDHPSAIFGVAFFVYLASYDWKKALALFLPAALPLFVLNSMINLSISGTLKPLQMIPSSFHFPGSYWMHPQGIDSLWEPKSIYAFNILFGHHGFFSMTPISFFGLAALWQTLKRRGEKWREALVVFLSMAVMIVFYVFSTKNYGGHSVGFRWMIPAMPPLLLFTALWLDSKPSKGWKVLFVVFFLVGFVNVVDALFLAWKEPSLWASLFYPSIEQPYDVN